MKKLNKKAIIDIYSEVLKHGSEVKIIDGEIAMIIKDDEYFNGQWFFDGNSWNKRVEHD